MSTAWAFAVLLRVLRRKNMTGDIVLCKIWYMYLLGEKKHKISSHAQKTEFWSIRSSFQNLRQAPLSYLNGYSSRENSSWNFYLLQNQLKLSWSSRLNLFSLYISGLSRQLRALVHYQTIIYLIIMKMNLDNVLTLSGSRFFAIISNTSCGWFRR